ncbi:MAG: alpha/beta fold hydrolase, partial [Chthoniobacteraceae bacterium]
MALTLGLVLLAAGLFYGWTEFARSLSPLKGWHLDAPASEFEAAQGKPGFTFEDYREQEQRVFNELEAFIAGPWSKQADARFSRFQAGSICNAANLLDRNWNQTFVLESPQPIGGALLLHGLSDSPYSMRAIGERLHARGFTVVGMRMPGHGTCPGSLAKVSWQDWTAAVRIGAIGLRKVIPKDAPLILTGFSNGGALSVHYALEATGDASLPKVDAVLLFSPMIGITPMARLTRFHRLIAAVSGERRANWSAVDAEIDPYKYNSWPMNASVQAWQMTHQVETGLAKLEESGRMQELPPILAFQSAIDSTVIVSRLITELFDRLKPKG